MCQCVCMGVCEGARLPGQLFPLIYTFVAVTSYSQSIVLAHRGAERQASVVYCDDNAKYWLVIGDLCRHTLGVSVSRSSSSSGGGGDSDSLSVWLYI